MPSREERHECPRCGQSLAIGVTKCPHCGLDFKKKGVFPTGCIIALLFLVGYPVLAAGTCLVLYFGVISGGPAVASGSGATLDALFPTAVFIAPALVMVVIAWLVIRKRGAS